MIAIAQSTALVLNFISGVCVSAHHVWSVAIKPNVDSLVHLEIPKPLPWVYQINARTFPVAYFSPFPSFTFGKFLSEPN